MTDNMLNIFGSMSHIGALRGGIVETTEDPQGRDFAADTMGLFTRLCTSNEYPILACTHC